MKIKQQYDEVEIWFPGGAYDLGVNAKEAYKVIRSIYQGAIVELIHHTVELDDLYGQYPPSLNWQLKVRHDEIVDPGFRDKILGVITPMVDGLLGYDKTQGIQVTFSDTSIFKPGASQ